MKKRIVILLLILSLALPAAGCFEKATAESLLEDATGELEKIESYEMKGSLELDIAIKSEDFDGAIVGEAEASGEITDKAAHLEGEYTFSSIDEEESGDIEMYLIEDKDEITAYLKAEDEWQKDTIEEDEEDFEEVQKVLEGIKLHKLVGLLTDYADDLELAKKTEKVGKIEAYVLEGKVSGEYFTDFLKSLDVEEIEEDIDEELKDNDVDLKDYEVDIRLLLNKKTKLPVLLEIDMTETVEKLAEDYLFQAMSGIADINESYDGDSDDEDDESEPAPEPDVEIEVKACKLEINFSSFGDVKSIKVPKDVKEEAEESSEDDDY